MYDLIANYLCDEPRMHVGRAWPSHQANFRLAIETADRCDTNGSIATMMLFNDLKSKVNGSLERAFNTISEKHLAGRWGDMPDDVRKFHDIVHFSMSVNRIEAAHRKATRMGLVHPYAVEITDLMICALPLADMFARLKVLAETSAAENRQARNARQSQAKPRGYVSPKVSNSYQRLVVTLLEGVTQKAYETLRSNIRSDILSGLTIFLAEAHTVTPYRFFKEQSVADIVMAQHVEKLVTKRDARYIRADDWEAVLMEIATDQADEYRTFFVHKNFDKIANIIEGKRGYNEATTVGHSVDFYGVEGVFNFKFADGSFFTVVNKAVMVVNGNGTRFVRHPLTFHDVVLPDGRKMNKPSQARMNDIFAKA